MNEDDVYLLLESSERVNDIIVSFTRCLILTLLAYFMDGIQYRELKAVLKISDGKLISNLNKLRELQYIEKFEEKIDHKKIDVYTLTENGRKELERIIEWMKLIKKVAKEDEKCQPILAR